MKYLILIYSNPRSRDIWDNFSDAERAEGWRLHGALVEDLAEAGELVVVEGLAEPSKSRTVQVTDGRTVTSDGPFAEAKEYLAGFFLIECESMERAIEHASRIPEATLGLVEVRPVLAPGGLEM
ncbi:YciI family protein [Micromonospora chersina]|uniref:YciI family protein n=1 Tax=Micromonospora chersina TaxID=47854 RepID=UPI0033D19F31